MQSYKFSLLALFFLCIYGPNIFAQSEKPMPTTKGTIITDDIMMLNTTANGLEPMACCPLGSNREYVVQAGKNVRLDWSLAKAFGADTMRIMLIEVLKGGASVAQFTLVLKPKQKPMTLQCLKGFGCSGNWEAYPWKSPKGNFLDHTVQRFRLRPNSLKFFTLENYDDKKPITIKVNPCGTNK